MYKYKIGYYTFEESDYVELEHAKKFSRGDITKFIAEAIVAIASPIKELKSWDLTFESLFNGLTGKLSIINWLIENKGFKIINYELVWGVFGWGNAFDKNDWQTEKTDIDIELNNEINTLLKKTGGA